MSELSEMSGECPDCGEYNDDCNCFAFNEDETDRSQTCSECWEREDLCECDEVNYKTHKAVCGALGFYLFVQLNGMFVVSGDFGSRTFNSEQLLITFLEKSTIEKVGADDYGYALSNILSPELKIVENESGIELGTDVLTQNESITKIATASPEERLEACVFALNIQEVF